MLIIICILGIIASAGGMPEPAAGIVGWVSKIGLGVSIVFYVRNAIKSELATIEKNKPPEGRERIMDPQHNEDINSPWRRKELIKWNAKHPNTLFEGPINENPTLRSLRLSLLTPEQLAMIPFWKRILVRNAQCHQGYFAGSYQCIICGASRYRDQKWCDKCDARYGNDIANGWHPDPKDHIKEGYEWVLWRLQQIVAQDRQLCIISEEIAKAEMKELVEVARQEIAEMERRELEEKVDIQRRKSRQSELSDIVKRLS